MTKPRSSSDRGNPSEPTVSLDENERRSPGTDGSGSNPAGNDPTLDAPIATTLGGDEAWPHRTPHKSEPQTPRVVLAEGHVLGSYRLERRIGAGGMGEVYAALHVQTNEQVALKTLSMITPTRLYRFKREFRALADVSHPNLVRLEELVVSETGPAYFTMELLHGRNFVEWIRRDIPSGELPELERLQQGLRQLVEGLLHLHAHDYVHRDLKPPNVLVTDEGRVVILDFGLVYEVSSPDQGMTRERQIVGTPAYMAPEQAFGLPTGAAADYYALGVMLFECLTGSLPVEGTALEQLVGKQDVLRDLDKELGAAPDWLRTMCVRLMARDPSGRPSTQELLEYLQAPGSTPARKAKVFVGRKRELDELDAAFGEVCERREPVVLHLKGRSGYGKSALLHRFRSTRWEQAIVLHGRCYERETVPYKGIDAVVDALAHWPERAAPAGGVHPAQAAGEGRGHAPAHRTGR